MLFDVCFFCLFHGGAGFGVSRFGMASGLLCSYVGANLAIIAMTLMIMLLTMLIYFFLWIPCSSLLCFWSGGCWPLSFTIVLGVAPFRVVQPMVTVKDTGPPPFFWSMMFLLQTETFFPCPHFCLYLELYLFHLLCHSLWFRDWYLMPSSHCLCSSVLVQFTHLFYCSMPLLKFGQPLYLFSHLNI